MVRSCSSETYSKLSEWWKPFVKLKIYASRVIFPCAHMKKIYTKSEFKAIFPELTANDQIKAFWVALNWPHQVICPCPRAI